MALTNTQLLSLGFKPSVRGRGGLSKTKKYDSLVLSLNDTDFLYTGYNPYKNQVNYKTIWKSFKDEDGNRITYQVVNLADTGFTELKNYITRSVSSYTGLFRRENEKLAQTLDPVAAHHSEAYNNTTPNTIDNEVDEILESPSENTIDMTTEIPKL